VMYLGKLVEVGPVEDVCTAPAHPYTAGLIAAVPAVTGEVRPTSQVRPPSSLPLATEPPSGCRFRTRCTRAQDICADAEPPLQPNAAGGQLVACHFPLENGILDTDSAAWRASATSG
jgi:peptide/nickel transport system ATP-binding protein